MKIKQENGIRVFKSRLFVDDVTKADFKLIEVTQFDEFGIEMALLQKGKP